MNPPESNSLSTVPPEAQPQRPHLVPPGGLSEASDRQKLGVRELCISAGIAGRPSALVSYARPFPER